MAAFFFFPSGSYTVEKEILVHTWESVLAEFGGYLGLLLGTNVFSMLCWVWNYVKTLYYKEWNLAHYLKASGYIKQQYTSHFLSICTVVLNQNGINNTNVLWEICWPDSSENEDTGKIDVLLSGIDKAKSVTLHVQRDKYKSQNIPNETQRLVCTGYLYGPQGQCFHNCKISW